MPWAARVQIRRLCSLGTARPHDTRFVRGLRARPLHHRRQGIGKGRDRAVSRAAGRRSLHHALPVARAATGTSIELDPAAWRDFRVVDYDSVGAGRVFSNAGAVPYSGTIPIQNMVLSPTSTSYLRTKVSLPSSPTRKTERPAGIVFTASPSLTFTGRLCCATNKRPLGSM